MAEQTQRRRHLLKGDLFVFPGAIAFHLIACAIPFTLLLVSVFGMVLSRDAAFRAVARFIISRLPSDSLDGGSPFLNASDIQHALAAVTRGRGAVGLIGLSSLLLTASGLMHILRSALNAAFDVPSRRHPIVSRFYGLSVFLLVGGFLFLSVFCRWGFTLGGDVLMQWLGRGQTVIRPAMRVLLTVATTAFNFGALYLIYRFLPDKEPDRRVAVTAAGLNAVLWEAARFGMGAYLRFAVRTYSVLYGAAAVFVVLGLWAYYASFIFVASAVAGRALAEGLPSAGPI